jgi:hypothetical protein
MVRGWVAIPTDMLIWALIMMLGSSGSGISPNKFFWKNIASGKYLRAWPGLMDTSTWQATEINGRYGQNTILDTIKHGDQFTEPTWVVIVIKRCASLLISRIKNFGNIDHLNAYFFHYNVYSDKFTIKILCLLCKSIYHIA